MTSLQRENLLRLLRPRHVAVAGGRDAEVVIKECRRIGFAGEIWPVNPNRDQIGGLACNASVTDLPEPPDATFIAVPARPALDIVRTLSEMGAGGVVCYTAGFGGDGREGGDSDRELVEAAGDMALVGPNCYGVINYVDRAALWPFPHGGYFPGYGAAIITQSGMLSSDITMNQRSLPLACMVSAGNQSVLGIGDYMELLSEWQEVRAIGVHIEGLQDVAAFARAAEKALNRNKPVVVMKTGTSRLGAELTVSHTGSLAGLPEYYQALFDRLGIISVKNPPQLVETLKYICICGVPAGNRLLGLTCSGGGATMLADHVEGKSIHFPSPSPAVADRLRQLLPSTADVTNPLDYTTPIWGNAARVGPVFSTALEDDYDATLIVQDYPLPGLDDSKHCYLSDATSLLEAAAKRNIPAAVISTLPENIDAQTRAYLVDHGVAPLQGIHEGLDAIEAVIRHGQRRRDLLDAGALELVPVVAHETTVQVDEGTAKAELAVAGFPVPEGKRTAPEHVVDVAREFGYPLALKLNSSQISHKTEIGAVTTGLDSEDAMRQALEQMQRSINEHQPAVEPGQFLVERMQPAPIAELMIGIRTDAQFGMVLTLAAGGTFAELMADAATLLLPATTRDIRSAIEKLKLARLLQGYRGGRAVDLDMLCRFVQGLCDYVVANRERIAELEINPLFVYEDRVMIVDVLMLEGRDQDGATLNAPKPIA